MTTATAWTEPNLGWKDTVLLRAGETADILPAPSIPRSGWPRDRKPAR